MISCSCPDCQPGNPAPTYTNEHKRRCEIALVLTMTAARLATYYEAVATHRGAPALLQLKREVDAEWQRRKALRSPSPAPPPGKAAQRPRAAGSMS